LQSKFHALRAAYPRSKLLIVSNSAGTNDDPAHADAKLLEKNTGIPVLRHSTKKPGCGPEILSYFRELPETGVTESNHIAVVGDRLFTDVMMANLMGSWSIWIKDGVVEEKSPVSARHCDSSGWNADGSVVC
jgi:phosphatidylglycerophosphatase GEP4